MTNVIALTTNPFTPSEPEPNKYLVHVMLDTETLGLDSNAIILSIGAVAFYDPQTLDSWKTFDEFYTDINPETYPGSVDISTIKWWMEQCHSGIPAPMAGVLALPAALDIFHGWLLKICDNTPKRLVIWTNGTDFDIPKLSNAYKLCGAKVPWRYSAVRDARTIFKSLGPFGTKPPVLNKHHALADAQWQTEYLISIFKGLEEKDVYVE